MADFVATPTQWAFMQSDAFVRAIMGPVGSSKSVMCCHEIIRRAMQQKPNARGERKTRIACVRNTVDQLKSTTYKTFQDWFGHWGTWRASEKTFYIDQPMADGTRLKSEILWISLDTPDDVRKALSLELTVAWLNEARELHPQVVDGLLLRLRRYPSMKDGGPTWSGAIADTNAPDIDSWWFNKFEEPPGNWATFVQPPAVLSKLEYIAQEGEDPTDPPIIGYDATEWWVNPRADNLQHLDPRYYPDSLLGKSQDFVDVYLRCKYGRSLSGLPVYDKTFNAELHVAKTPFIPLKSDEYPVVIGLDFGRTPAAALVQRNAWGQIVVLDELTSENMGIETFTTTKLKPLLSQTKYLGCTFMVAPDPAGWAKQQIGEISPVDVVKKAGFKVVKPPTNDPERRIMAVERLLTAPTVGGKTAFQINPECRELLKGFRYGYRYKLNKAGQQDHKPDKNEFSHIHDAAQYAALVVEGNMLQGSYFGNSQRREIKRVNYAYA